MDFCDLLARSVKQNASDLHLCTGYPPVLRIDGALQTIEAEPITSRQIDSWLAMHLPAEADTLWRQQHQVDFALNLHGGIRLRVNAFQQLHGPSLALRIIPNTLPTLHDLSAPAALANLLEVGSGLILVCGATGSGKSTTLAAMLNHINHHQPWHIITLEDPLEFIHIPQQSLIQQREIGSHVPSFNQALRAALREDPDVILLGELRDAESIRLALTAAETGHLVLATLHTRGAAQAVERLIDVFPAEEKNFVRTQIAGSLQAVLAQQLLPKQGGGRVAAFEFLLNTPAVSNLIREEKAHQIATVLQTGQRQGMLSFEQDMARLNAQGILGRIKNDHDH
ncbi:MAG: type IV pilus twitching motility protein PilT [Hafnia sp.]|uniref:type IV pilus twitching motility protein PilT n=1 Tax=Hafnia TaxID=568 RepID=UPI001033BB7C|nr:type IV pilus twitching motility protein PilT [Hafnia alvei]MCE9873080.1 type IV pilus twitching motility protein PilT [Hafnia alvei]NEY28011.1 type IV pilus twitching motility protein PilT [Escherichia coli]TBL92194.1 type IV pilus twitching motility protein PilT [Hafnia alvei]